MYTVGMGTNTQTILSNLAGLAVSDNARTVVGLMAKWDQMLTSDPESEEYIAEGTQAMDAYGTLAFHALLHARRGDPAKALRFARAAVKSLNGF
jgi:hypothetical protein